PGTEDPDFSWKRRIRMLSVKGGSPGAVCEAVGIQDLSWSPDGRHIAFRATSVDPYNPSASFGLWVVPATGGEPVEITAGFDGFVGNDRLVSDVMRNRVSQRAVWSADSRNLHFLASEGGDLTLRRVALDGGPVHRMNDGIEGDRAVHSFDYCPGEDLFVAVVSSFDLPGDLWLLPRGERLTAVNDDWLSGLELSTGERLSWNSYDGTGIEGWILKPPGFDESRDYPAILSIHGGPYRHYGAVFFFEMQMLAAEGYVVFCPNPRGSHGYGQAFAGAIYDDWGNLDYHDLMSGVDCLLTLGFVDENRLGVTGGSYGGYMTNWIITQTPRFKAAIADRSVSNLHSLLGTDIQYSLWESPSGDAWEWDGIMHALMRSPLTHADRVKTPLLLIHPTDDQCCPIEQAEQFYTALKRLGSAVELLLFPGASHELPRSGNLTQRVQRLQWITAWFNEQLTDSDDS
ncbi:MAG: S9 family peptidase, partial [Bacillota bacterium]